MDSPTKKELDAKANETHALWVKANEAGRIAAACEEEFKEMRHRYYSNKFYPIQAYESMVGEEKNHVD